MGMGSASIAEIEVQEQVKSRNTGGPWNVVLWDDDFHTYDYVITMLVDVCQMTVEKAFKHALQVDTEKKTIVFSGEFEHAEHVHDLIINYGPDPRMIDSKGSMTATLEQT